jgi:hypothetical protein
VRINTTPNLYSEAIDSLFYVSYPGAEFWLMRAGFDGREFLGNVHMTEPISRLPSGLRFGRTIRDSLLSRFGRADETHKLGDTLVLGYANLPDSAVGAAIDALGVAVDAASSR